MAFKDGKNSTLTHRFAAIQIKMWHLQFRMREIYKSQELLQKVERKPGKDSIKKLGPAIFSTLDMISAFEHLAALMADIFETEEIRSGLSSEQIQRVGQTKDRASRWIAVRNKLGGHIDVSIVEDMCKRHNYFGTLLSEDLKADMVIYQTLLLESAVNKAREKSDLFGRDLDFQKNFTGELALFVDKLNEDWSYCFGYFEPLIKQIYLLGKREKIKATSIAERKGIITGD